MEGNTQRRKGNTATLRVTFDASTLIDALANKEPASGLLDRARNGEFDLAVLDVVFDRLDERSRPAYLARASFAARIREPSAELGKALLGRMMLGGYPIPWIHGDEKVGSGSWARTSDDALVLAAHTSYGRHVLETTDKKLRTRAAKKGIRTATPADLLAMLESVKDE